MHTHTQLFIITPLFALLGARKPKATLALLGLLSVVSILYSWIQVRTGNG